MITILAVLVFSALVLGGYYLIIKYDSTEIPNDVPFLKDDPGYNELYEKKEPNNKINMKKNKILVIVDFQKDFYDVKEGALYVPGAERCVTPICDKILSGEFDQIILTVDWHHLEDKSFKRNDGMWPDHCVQYSEGAAIHPDIMNAIKETGIPYDVFTKGNCFNHEEYGAFERCHDFGNSVVLKNFLGDSTIVLKDRISKNEVVICGLAGDYCVFETYKNLVKVFGAKDVKPYYEGIAFIGEEFDIVEKYQEEIGPNS